MHFRHTLNWFDVTPKHLWINRRHMLAGGAAMLATPALARIEAAKSPLSTDEAPNSLEDITTYNNYYEFGTGKSDPASLAGGLTVDPWSIAIDGMVDRPGTYDLADVIKDQPLEERIYRFRCVEAWSMVVPWIGFQLSGLLDRIGVQPGARFVAFETLLRPEEMPGQSSPFIEWPYREGLRLDEAMHPLTILATGLYGDPMPKQNGAPIRLVVPWKYGFKSIKSIVRISLVAEMPPTTWNMLQPQEYGFYSNVKSRGRSPPLEPGLGTPHRQRSFRRAAGYPDVQWLWRAGCIALFGPGPREGLLMDRLNAFARRVPTWVVYMGGTLPFLWLAWNTVQGNLGADPVKAVEHRLGELGLQFLLASLAITPLRRLGLNLIRFRRALGLLAFSYVSLHLVAWVWLDMGLRWAEVTADLWKRPYVILGMVGFLTLLPLALTSSNWAIRRMGPKAWQRLHQLAYVAVIAGVLHLLLLVKVWTAEELTYAVLVVGLLAVRLVPKGAWSVRAAG